MKGRSLAQLPTPPTSAPRAAPRSAARSRVPARCRPSCACSSCRPAGTPRRSSAGPPRAIPGPVSATDTTNASSTARASISTCPVSVNLIALPARFSSTCVSRRSSPRPVGRSGGTIAFSASFFPAASDSTAATTACTTSPIAYSPSDSVSCPASIFDRSSTSLIRPSRCCPFVLIRSSVSRIGSGTSPKMLSRIRSV